MRILVTRTDFVETNVTGTLNLLEEAVNANVSRFIFTSTTNAFGRALTPALGWGRCIVSATTPFTPANMQSIGTDLPTALARLFPDFEDAYEGRGWRMFPAVERTYVNERARTELGFSPRYDFRHALDGLANGEDPRSALARSIGAKGYHEVATGVYTAR